MRLPDSQKASEMVMAFANLMRYSVYYGSTIVPLQTDIEYTTTISCFRKCAITAGSITISTSRRN